MPRCHLGLHIHVSPDRTAIVDAEDFVNLPKTGWSLKVTPWGEYAQRVEQINGKRKYIYMHRLIMLTPKGQEVHHLNTYSLDNRRLNMLNVTKAEHKDIQAMARISKKNIIFPFHLRVTAV